MNQNGPFVAQLDLALAPRLKQDLEAQGFELSQPEYTLFAARKAGLSCTLYKSGKLVVQGKKKGEFIEFYLEPEILGTFTYGLAPEVDRRPRIGSDEAGKGDYFGPLVVAGVFADDKVIDKLVEAGVRDSKNLKDPRILSLAQKIAKLCPYHVLRLHPPKYNELYAKFGNLNHMLAWAHAAVLETLHKKTGCRSALVDQFANEHVLANAVKRKGLVLELTQRTKGESDVVVAAASILARATFVHDLDNLAKRMGIRLPKGASNGVKAAAQQIADRLGRAGLESCAKLHFKTTKEVLGHA